jgi:hypothetical protein
MELFRVNSITCDTYNTIRCVEKDLKKIASLGHIFFLLCTTHSFNLVYKDCLVNRKTTKAIPDLTK